MSGQRVNLISLNWPIVHGLVVDGQRARWQASFSFVHTQFRTSHYVPVIHRLGKMRRRLENYCKTTVNVIVSMARTDG